MKILKIFGVVVGIHLFALILIFANPGCTSTSKPTPAPIDTVAKSEPAPAVSVPMSTPMTVAANFNPEAPATAGGASSAGVRFTPTRPNTTASSAVTAAPVADVTPATTYVVKSGDSLWELGKKFHVPYAEIAAANGIKSSAALHAGQKLIIPGKPAAASNAAVGLAGAGATKAGAASAANKAAAPAKPATAGATGSSVKHTVAPGETMSAIAHKYGVSLRELGAANNISDPQKIRAGMELVIPGWSAAGGSATKSGSKSSKSGAGSTAPAAEPKPIFNLLEQGSSKPAGSGEPPVIKVEDSPIVAPKGN